MDRLTKQAKFPLTTFKRCQLCGHTNNDICEFRMFVECDETDKPEPGNILILCQQDGCQKILDDHPRLYKSVPWGAGGPGKFILLCGDCRHRDEAICKHEKLKANGGSGLKISFSKGPLGGVHVCFMGDDGEMQGYTIPPPATECEGQESHTVWDRLQRED